MKKITLIVFLFISLVSHGQISQPRFYLGLSIGSSKVIDSKPKITSGLNINFLNAGYSITKGFGIASKWMMGKHTTSTSFTISDVSGTYSLPAKEKNEYNAIMIGPMYSLLLTKNLILDFKALAGGLFAKEEYKSATFNPDGKASSFGYSFGLSLRYNFTNHFYLNAQSDYTSGGNVSLFQDGDLKILNLNGGIGVCF